MTTEELERAYELVDDLLGKMDLQTSDQKVDADMPDDAEYAVTLSARDERNLNEAALLLKRRLDQADIAEGQVKRWRTRAAAAEAVLEFIVAGYARVDINHEDFRVRAYKAALETLETSALPNEDETHG